MKYLYMSFMIFVVTVAVLAAGNNLPPFIQEFYNFPYGDKVLHLFLVGGCNGALLLFLKKQGNLTTKRVIRVTVVMLLISTGDEFLQQAFPHRTFSYKDLAANYMGIIGSALTISFFTLRQKKEKKEVCPTI